MYKHFIVYLFEALTITLDLLLPATFNFHWACITDQFDSYFMLAAHKFMLFALEVWIGLLFWIFKANGLFYGLVS